VIPVGKGTNVTLSKSLRQYLGNIFEQHEIKELQKTFILVTAHILRKVLMKQYKTFIKANSIACTASCNYRTDATLSTLGTWFLSGT